MFLQILRKMLRNKWMVLCLVIGSLLAVSTISSIPLYSNGIFQRMLIQDLENYQQENDQYPGQYTVYQTFDRLQSAEDNFAGYQQVEETVTDEWVSELGLPILAQSRYFSTISLRSLSDVYAEQGSGRAVDMNVTAMKDMEEHITLLSGSFPSGEMKDGYYEVMLAENAMGYLGLSTGDTAVVSAYKGVDMEPVKIRVSGVFSYKDYGDLFWRSGPSMFAKSMVMNETVYQQLFLSESTAYLTTGATWYYVLDYTEMKVADVSFYQSVLSRHQKEFTSATKITVPMTDLLQKYSARMDSLSLTLWILQIPVILMLLLYIFMVSKLIVDYDSNDIAVQKSRGSSNFQIFTSYLLEGGIIAAIAFLLGPLIGYVICRFLGLSSGFLEFVSRKGVQVDMVPDVYLYALLAVGAFLVTMVVPVLLIARGNIVKHKRAKSRNTDKPFWKKFYLDIVLMGVSIYGYFSYQNSISLLLGTNQSAGGVTIDPLLFMFSTLFILASALLFLRLYPLFIRLVFWVGKKHWGPATYASLINVSRTRASQFLMVFLIMTVSLGLFNSVSARTINAFLEDQVDYRDGADLTLETTWRSSYAKIKLDSEGNLVPFDPSQSDGAVEYDGQGTPVQSGSDELSEEESGIQTVVVYSEPPFSQYTQLETIETATKVYRDDNATIRTEKNGPQVFSKVDLMGIVPHEFGKVVNMRSDLLPVHINEYLNILTQTPNTVFISRSMTEGGEIKPGDTIYLSWSGQYKYLEVIVGGVVDYWPSLNPQKTSASESTPRFIIGNWGYLTADTMIRPYEVWMSRADGATTEDVYEEFKEKNISYNDLVNKQQDLVALKNDPMLQGTNGTLTLGFVIIMAVTFIGFLIYWIFDIRSRTLQFGILRAMGLSKKKLIGMILWEQILISGVAILAGVGIGTLASNLFVPFLRIVYSAAEQVPPFRVVIYAGDYLRIFAILGVMLLIGAVVLGVIISRIKMDQALKLGED